MKIRSGFVSNSSSSSFILKKSVLTDDQITLVRNFLTKYNTSYGWCYKEDDQYFTGDLEAHNAREEDLIDGIPERERTACSLFDKLINDLDVSVPNKIPTKWYDSRYCDWPSLTEEDYYGY